MNGQTITIKTGDQLVLSLESNPTTGFDWELLEVDESDHQAGGRARF